MFALIVIASVTAMVWGTYLLLRGSVVAGCALYLVAASCFGFDFWNFDVAGITLSLDRLLLTGIVLAYIVQSRQARTPSRDIPCSDWCLIAFVVLLLANLLLNGWQATHPGQVPIIQHLINGYLIPVALYWVVRHSALNQRNVSFVLAVFVCFGIYLAVTALLEIGEVWSLVYPKYISNPDLGIHFHRARGPFLQSVRLGMMLVTCLAATWLYLSHRARWGRAGQLLAVVLVPVYLAAMYFTYTRSVWLGTVVAAFIVLTLTLQGTWRRLVIGGLICSLVLLVAVNRDSLLSMKRGGSELETRSSTSMRASFAYVSWQMFKEKPLLGYGFGQFPKENRRFLGDRGTNLRLEAIRGYVHHNTFLCVLVETGLIGFVLFCGLLFCWTTAAWKLWRDAGAPPWMRGQGLLFLAVAGAYGTQMMFHDVTYSPVENGCFFLLAAVTLGLKSQRALSASPAEVRARRLTGRSFSFSSLAAHQDKVRAANA